MSLVWCIKPFPIIVHYSRPLTHSWHDTGTAHPTDYSSLHGKLVLHPRINEGLHIRIPGTCPSTRLKSPRGPRDTKTTPRPCSPLSKPRNGGVSKATLHAGHLRIILNRETIIKVVLKCEDTVKYERARYMYEYCPVQLLRCLIDAKHVPVHCQLHSVEQSNRLVLPYASAFPGLKPLEHNFTSITLTVSRPASRYTTISPQSISG